MDRQIVLALNQLAVAQPGLIPPDVVVAQYGIFLVPVALVVLWLVPGRDRRDRRQVILAAAISFAVALVASEALGLLVYRPRPFVALEFPPLFPYARDSSFPSDHALLGAALVWPFGWISLRRCLLLLLWVVIVGFARVMAGLHYPTDVLAGVGLGLVAALLGLVIAAYLVSRVPALRHLVYAGR